MSDDKIVDFKEAKKGRRTKRRAAPTTLDGSKPLSELIDELNRQYALVIMGGKTVVLDETTDIEGRPVTHFMGVQAFKEWTCKVRIIDWEAGRVNGLGEMWMKHPDRRDYRGVDFAPEGVPPGWYNLWRGLPIEPAPLYEDRSRHWREHFPTFFDHMNANVAQGDRDVARWIWGWFAHMIQRPTERIGTALVLRGKKGVGKSKPGEVIGLLLGRHWIPISDPKHLTGSFNAHMFGCLLLQADEAIWAGDKEAEGTLKSLITSSVHLLERKGIDAIPVRNLVRVFMTSNNDWVVPASLDERRFAVFDVGEAVRKNHEYFALIDKEMANGGLPHLLTWLRTFDLSSVDLRNIPMTAALADQKLKSLSALQLWWLDILQEGRLLASDPAWRGEVGTDALYHAYSRHVERVTRKRLLFKSEFGKELAELMPDGFRNGQKVKEPELDGHYKIYKRVNGYRIPPLADCRAKFVDLIGREMPWAEEDEVMPDSS